MCDLEAKFVATFMYMVEEKFVATFMYIVEVEESNHQESELQEFETFGKNNKMFFLRACEGGGKNFKVLLQCLVQ
jgi:hypothetical protein